LRAEPNACVRPAPESVLLGIGSNQGDRLAHLRSGVFSLAIHPEIEVLDLSRVYRTDYVGPGEQDPYLNACLRIGTTLAPRVLLLILKLIEQRHGRAPDSHMAPRPLDIDILTYGSRLSGDPVLTLPHPRLRERAFVLEPLQEIAPDFVLPDCGQTVRSACEKIRRRGGPRVSPLPEEPDWPRPVAGRKDDWRASLAVHGR